MIAPAFALIRPRTLPPPRFPIRPSSTVLEQPLCTRLALDVPDTGLGDLVPITRGVNYLSPACGYSDVGDTAMLFEEDQVARRGPRDSRAITVLLLHSVRQRNVELLVDLLRKAGAVYSGA